MSSPLIVDELPLARRPVLVCAFEGWNDAGDAASCAVDFIHRRLGAREFAHIDPEEFYDFTAVRPTVSLTADGKRELTWPRNVFSFAEVPGADGDLIVLRGVEPSLRWRTYTRLVLDLAERLNVRLVVSLGSLLADVPHTRPVTITGFASDPSVLDRLGVSRSSYEGPTGIVGVLHHACAQAGLAAISLWASAPHYVAATPNTKVALALVRAFEGAAKVVVEASELEQAAEEYERRVTAAVQQDPEARAFVERLESAADDDEELAGPRRIPSGDTIARDFQRFLRQRGSGRKPGDDEQG
ncbi:PAC2 family protein [Thermoleophilum album]|uniref:Proteasome assembly chaperone (PAC2) family protein n=1 Tax=Thermoleophilum album TaxID=29539 RepID=A0A1H6FMJ4_THEAL|nr:PAC2 family protein [Thermoleophilum album]SEH11410.1 Proteasome assembly chaperone (PAC2) family protein [Thermoleophilum album]